MSMPTNERINYLCDWGVFPLGALRPPNPRRYFRTSEASADKIRTMHKN